MPADGWQSVRLADVVSKIRNGTTARQVSRSTPHPVSRIETIAEGTIDWDRVGYLSTAVPGYELRGGDVLYSHINSLKHMGKVALFDGSRPLFHGMNLMLLRFDRAQVDPRYCFRVLQSEKGRAHARREAKSAINQASLGQSQILSLSLTLPPLPEQRRIAEILDTLDAAIRKTEQVIAKLQQMKQGLLHDLLTRGIDERGELRDPERHPEQFKDSPLGRIPSGWEIAPLREVAAISSGTTPSRSAPRYWQGGIIPWVKTAEVRGNRIEDSEERVTEVALLETGLRLYPPGTVLVAMYGQGATRGRAALLGIPATTNQACAAIECEPGRLLPTFLLELLGWSYERLRGAGHGSNQTNLSAALLGDLSFFWPPAVEQRRIDDVLGGVRARLKAEREGLEGHAKLKLGLMDDLLTGRVRVLGRPEGMEVKRGKD